MPTITTDDLADLLVSTQKDLGEMRFNQIATRLQDYEVFPHLWKREKVDFQGGVSISRNIMVDHSGAAKQTSLFGQDQVSVNDVMQTIERPWRFTTTNYAYERRELLMNQGKRRLIKLIKIRRCDAMISLVEHVEDQFFAAAPASTDETEIHGLKYWVVSNSSSTPGFNGGAASGNTDVAGLSPTTYSRWKNYTAIYTTVSKGDLVRKMRTAYKRIRFKSPISIPDYRTGKGDRYRIYMNEDTITSWETLAENQNENLGKDLAPYDGNTVFKRNPIIWVPKLDGSTSPTNPVYMLDWNYIQPVFLSGDYLHEERPKQKFDSHNTLVVHIDCTWNILFTDRRSQAVLATTA